MSNLTAKQKLWADHYVICLNATEAARLAGYSGDDNVLATVGYENLRKPKIRDYVDSIFEQQGMGTKEVIARLAAQAIAEVSDFITIDPLTKFVRLDLGKASARGKLHAIKKLNFGDLGFLKSIELHDQQAALVHIGKAHGLFKDVHKVEDWRDTALEYIRDGKIKFPAAAAEFGEDLATKLFKQAGVPVEVE
jgi:hypothetical protein